MLFGDFVILAGLCLGCLITCALFTCFSVVFVFVLACDLLVGYMVWCGLPNRLLCDLWVCCFVFAVYLLYLGLIVMMGAVSYLV